MIGRSYSISRSTVHTWPMIRKDDPYFRNFADLDYPHFNDAQDEHRRRGLALIKAMDDAVGGPGGDAS